MPIEALRCPNCGAPLETNQKFCDHCGIGLKSTDPEPKEKPRGFNISIDGKDKTYNYGFSFDSFAKDKNQDGGSKVDYNSKYNYGNVDYNTQRPNDAYSQNKIPASTLSKDIALVLALISLLFIGGIAVHKIYLKKFGDFVLSIIFCWTFIPFIVCLCNVISLATMSKEAFYKKYC